MKKCKVNKVKYQKIKKNIIYIMSFNREDYQRYVNLYESKLCTDVLIATNDKIPDIQRIESKENAKRLARESGKSETSDTLEGRIMQLIGEWRRN